jgi:hypothetical protein
LSIQPVQAHCVIQLLSTLSIQPVQINNGIWTEWFPRIRKIGKLHLCESNNNFL